MIDDTSNFNKNFIKFIDKIYIKPTEMKSFGDDLISFNKQVVNCDISRGKDSYFQHLYKHGENGDGTDRYLIEYCIDENEHSGCLLLTELTRSEIKSITSYIMKYHNKAINIYREKTVKHIKKINENYSDNFISFLDTIFPNQLGIVIFREEKVYIDEDRGLGKIEIINLYLHNGRLRKYPEYIIEIDHPTVGDISVKDLSFSEVKKITTYLNKYHDRTIDIYSKKSIRYIKKLNESIILPIKKFRNL